MTTIETGQKAAGLGEALPETTLAALKARAATTITRTALIAALVAPALLPACTAIVGSFR